MYEPKVSIVIATHNMGHLICDTICSCQLQRYRNKEIIVYDDCSTDDTESLLVDIPNVKYYYGEVNVGVGNAFNAAIEKATGEIIILMCADDLFANKHVIKDIVNTFESNDEIGHVTRYYHQFIDYRS